MENQMQRTGPRSTLVVITLLTATGCAPPTTTGHSCSPNYIRENKLGRLAVQQRGPGSSVAWGAYPKLPAERYRVSVYAGGRKVDGKNQTYPPHGSIPGNRYQSGQAFRIEGKSFDSKGGVVQTFFIKCTLA